MAGSRKTSEYLIALGSNRRHARWGAPPRVLRAALAELGTELEVTAATKPLSSAPLGPSRRRYANAAALLRTRDIMPPELLARLKAVERRFGRRRGGQRWGSRVLDLDIILWSGGPWASKGLVVPHVSFRDRQFVLGPASQLAPRWRDPVTGLTLRQLHARATRSLTRPLPLPR